MYIHTYLYIYIYYVYSPTQKTDLFHNALCISSVFTKARSPRVCHYAFLQFLLHMDGILSVCKMMHSMLQV